MKIDDMKTQKKPHFFAAASPLFLILLIDAMGLGLVDYFTHHFSLKNNAVTAISVGAVITIGIVCSPSLLIVWLLIIPMSLVMSFTYSVVLTIFSNQVDADHQGWVMGITGAIMALVFGVNALVVGFLADVNPRLPLVVCAISLACTGLLMQLLDIFPNLVFCLRARRVAKRAAEFTQVNEQRSKQHNAALKQKTTVWKDV